MDPRFIRNFSIIAHIDHGKSTLADRFLELTGALQAREMEAQVLDSMDLERERGITIKAHPVRLRLHGPERRDLRPEPDRHARATSTSPTRSPGRSSACEGALLLVDASQGVEAQTLANAYLAVDNDLEIIPVINKIDLPGAQPEEARRQIEDIIGLDASGAILTSAKMGTGVQDVLEAIVHRVPPPAGSAEAPLKALIFDSWYDAYRGVRDRDADHRRQRAAGHEDPADGAGAGLRGERARHLHAQARAGRRARRRRGRLHRGRHQERGRRADRRHHHRGRRDRRRSRSRASRS